MADPDELLAESVREALRHSDRRILFALLLGVFYAALVFGGMDRPDGTVSVPLIGLDTDARSAGWIALGASWVSAAAAGAALEGLAGTAKKIQQAGIRSAALTYPSFVTSTASGWAYGPSLLLVALLVVPTMAVVHWPFSVWDGMLLGGLLGAPVGLAVVVRDVRKVLAPPQD